MISQSMQRMTAVLMLTALGLYGCGGDEQTVTPPGPEPDLFYTYPYAGQTNVSTNAKVLVRVSAPVTNADALNDGVVSLHTGDGTDVPAEARLADETAQRSVVLEPEQALDPHREYRVVINGLETANGTVKVEGDGYTFTTRAAAEGPRASRITAEAFELTRQIPAGDELPVMDFSAFRFQFSQPVDEQSVEYGHTVTLTGPDDSSVKANVATRGRLMTVDPVEDLSAGQTYTLEFTDGLQSIYDNALQEPFDGGFSRAFVPRESAPTEQMALNAPEGGLQSPLTGTEVNLVPVQSTLINTQSQQGGNLAAELAYVPNYPDVTPLRVPAGMTLTGDALSINLDGEVPVGFDSGDLRVELINDATGYLMPNPWSDSPEAPRQLRLFMDVGVATGNNVANAGFTQDVLHLEVVGQAIVEDGVLKGDGLTVVETSILGVDRASGMLSFHMKGYQDQNNAPQPREDTAAPFVKSWMPGKDHVGKQRPGDPIIVNFNQPLASHNLRENITVLADGAQVDDVEIEQEGAAVVIRTDLDYGVQYDIQLSSDLRDLAGNRLSARTLSFTMSEPVTPAAGDVSSPFVTNTYPGFPCPKTDAGLADGHVGYCAGGKASDDRLPIPEMPADRAIRVHFSHPVDEASFAGGSGFTVEKRESPGSWTAVSGEISFREQEVRFMPDQPWEQGSLYRYTLKSNGNPQGSNCNPSSMICGEDGLPLKTRRLAQNPDNAPATNGGGPPLRNVFRAVAPKTDSIFVHLDLRDTADRNANAVDEPAEPNAADEEGNSNPPWHKNSIKAIANDSGGSIAEANVGCPVPENESEECPENKFAYVNGGLNVEIHGYLTPDEAEQRFDDGELRKQLPPEVQDHGGILFYAYPTMVQASQLIAHAETSIPGTSAEPADTGPMLMRVRHQCDARANSAAPPEDARNADALPQCEEGNQGLVEAWIVNNENDLTVDGPEVIASLDAYLDAPELEPVVNLDLGLFSAPVVTAEHNARSLGLGSYLQGAVEFQDDGRIQIAGINQSNVDTQLVLTFPGVDLEAGNVELRIPKGGLYLSFLSQAPLR